MLNSIYIHIPFCKKICNYCDFCKIYYDENTAEKYLESLKKEIESYSINGTYKTIYIGGGTPSSLSITLLEKLFSYLKNIKLVDDYEFTFECNIDDITEEKLRLLKDNRVNRLSIGVETINRDLQKFINRLHTKEEITNKITISKKYFSNINIDLIYAIPGETLEILKEDLDFITNFNINHISLYSLIIEEHTKLYIDNVKPIDDNLDYEMYYYIINYLKEKGYKHYEVSNFAKEGYQSIHNLTYWNNNKYYGLGLGASGYINNTRYNNTRSITKYLKGEYI
jgi:oxygen-independent coproporphyrinogen-3 oxidase